MNVVISPHLDDGVLSYGGALGWSRRETQIVTVLAGLPPEWSWPTPFDSASGFADSRCAVLARRAEDANAARELDVGLVHLPFLDGQYGLPRPETGIIEVLRGTFAGADDVAVPLGLAHPDHRLVARCCRAALAQIEPRPFLVYADLPAARLYPSHVPGAMRGWARAGWSLVPSEWRPNLERKQRAWECYASQQRFPELVWENLIGEHGWRATAAA